MGISPRSTFGWLDSATLDGSSFYWLFNWLGSLCVDVLAWLDCINAASYLCRECRAKTYNILQVTNSLGRLILRLCMASDLGSCLRDGNTLTWTHHPGGAWRVNQRFASLSDLGPACWTQHLDSPRRLDFAGSDFICCIAIRAIMAFTR